MYVKVEVKGTDLIDTKGDYQSLNECRHSIEMMGIRIAADCSSTFINEKRIESMKGLLDLFGEYNKALEDPAIVKQLEANGWSK